MRAYRKSVWQHRQQQINRHTLRTNRFMTYSKCLTDEICTPHGLPVITAIPTRHHPHHHHRRRRGNHGVEARVALSIAAHSITCRKSNEADVRSNGHWAAMRCGSDWFGGGLTAT